MDHPWELTDSGMVSLWVWSPEAKTVVLRQVPPKSAELYLAARFARQALEIAPDSSANQTVYLGILLEDAAYEAGANRPLPAGPGTAHDLALLAGSEVVLETLAHSLRQSRPATAVACLQVLSQIATQGEMRLKFPKESRVLSAINYPDRRVQFAAASTILQADPTEPFRGASRVVEVLARVLSDRGQARGVVIDPNVDRAGRVAGFMNDLGYDSGIALTGMEGFRSVAERNDVELIAVHVGVVEWGLNQTIANLKADARTAGIPIVIYGSQMLRAKLEPLAARYPQVAYIIESSSSGDFASQVRPFREKFSSPALTPEQRHEQRLAAAYWLSHIASGSRTRVFNVQPAEETLVAVTSDPELAISALVTLAAIPTVTAQQTMFEVAVNRNQTADIREVAALQLAFHVQKHGLLLAAQAVDDIHASWRAATDPRVSTALAGVIGSLQPNPTLVGDRLRAFPPRVTPTVP